MKEQKAELLKRKKKKKKASSNTIRGVKDWTRLIEVVESPSLEVSKSRLAGLV